MLTSNIVVRTPGNETDSRYNFWYTHATMHTVHVMMASAESSKLTGERFTLFYGSASPFSQWHPAKFTVDGVEYNCAEQYMMHQKAGT